MGVHQEEGATVVRSEAATQTTQMGSEEMDIVCEAPPVKQRRHRDVNLETRAYFSNFMTISDEVPRPQYETQESLGLGLNFSCTDIEADGGTASSPLHGDDNGTCSGGNIGSDLESHQSTGEDRHREGDSQVDETQDKFRKGGMELRGIADEIDRQFLGTNSTAREVLEGFIEQQVQRTADHAFEHIMEQVLEEFNGSFPQHDDKHQVALVMLCTRRSIIAVNSALNAAKDTSEDIIGSAMSYIASHYPSWTDSFR